jgi:hypothetical protein
MIKLTVLSLSCAVALLLASAAPAQRTDLLLSRWLGDVHSIQQEILVPLNQEFEAHDKSMKQWWSYSAAFLDKLRERREQMEPYSYDVVREIVLSMEESFSGNPAVFTWREASRYIDVNLHLVSSVMTHYSKELNAYIVPL